MQVTIEIPDKVVDSLLIESEKSELIHRSIAGSENYPGKQRELAAMRAAFLSSLIASLKDAKATGERS